MIKWWTNRKKKRSLWRINKYFNKKEYNKKTGKAGEPGFSVNGHKDNEA